MKKSPKKVKLIKSKRPIFINLGPSGNLPINIEYIIDKKVLEILKMPTKKAIRYIKKITDSEKSGTATYLDVAVITRVISLVTKDSKPNETNNKPN